MKNIGKYQGILCYECNNKEYKDVLKSGQDNGKAIFIIDGTMVKKNEIVGYYDGNHVREVYDGVPYIVEKQPGPIMPMDIEVEKVEVKDINYANYTQVVDNFFANLKDPVV